MTRPHLTGVPARFFDLKRSFSFANLEADIDHSHPWKALENVDNSGCINGYADQSVITWGLHKQIGDTIRYLDEKGRQLSIRLAGGLKNSVFQGNLLISDSILRLHFPSSAKINNMLIDVPSGSGASVIRILEERLHDLGTVVLPTSEKLATFNVVEDTYLDVFLLLAGLGMVIGTAGLAVMVLRNLRNRRRELILYSALGFPIPMTYRMLAREFLFILLTGIFIGMLSAFAGSLPSLLLSSPGTLIFPGILLSIILVNGLIWIHFPIRHTLRSITRQPIRNLLSEPVFDH